MKTPQLTRTRFRSASAFTLIEMLLVLAIISILISAGIYKMGGARETARIEATRMSIIKLQSNIQEYELNTRGGPPSSEAGLNALVNRPSGDGAPRSWRQVLKEVPLDQWDNPFQYRKPARNGGGEYEIYSWGPDGKEGGGDDITSADEA